MTRALAIVNARLLRSPLAAWLQARCQERGVALTLRDVNAVCEEGAWLDLLAGHGHVLTWNVRVPSKHLRPDLNVLWLDHSLLSQRAGVFIDSRGLFAQSNLRRAATAPRPERDYNAAFYGRREFGWTAFGEGRPDGDVLVCLQCAQDSSLTWSFLPGEQGLDRVAAFLDRVAAHLPFPRERVVIRPHPLEPDAVPDRAAWPWARWDSSTPFKVAVREAAAVVTVSSTCAHEAVLAGVPVATLGTGTFTGWGITLECAEDPRLLRSLATWRPDPAAARAYVTTAMTRHFLPYDLRLDDLRPQATEFWTWLNRIPAP